MQLNSILFIAIFLIALILYYLIPDKFKTAVLALVSVAIYTAFGLVFTLILLLTVVITYLSAIMIHRIGSNRVGARVCLWATIILFGAVFALFRADWGLSSWAPIGFSFYALQAIGYVVDVYNDKILPERNILKHSLYVSFFPTITSGPIQRSEKFLKQIQSFTAPDYEHIRHGLLRIAYGLFLKNVIADKLAVPVNYAFDYWHAQSGAALLLGAVLFAFQLYFDFAGYSNIAIGMAETLGFNLDENFRQPYFSKSVKEFWSRWHISLSEWLKDYIYIPLGGSRRGAVRTMLNILVVFIVSGIWHGRGLNFIIWGLLHGIYRLFEYLAEAVKKKKTEKSRRSFAAFLKIIGCFIVVDFAWIFFRADSLGNAISIIKKIIFEFDIRNSIADKLIMLGKTKVQWLWILLSMGVALAIDVVHYRGASVSKALKSFKLGFRWVVYIAFVCFMLWFTAYNYGGDVSAFIYAQF